MRIVLVVLQVVFVLLACFTLIFALLAHASGHNVPAKTDRAIVSNLVVLGILFALVALIKKKWFPKRQ